MAIIRVTDASSKGVNFNNDSSGYRNLGASEFVQSFEIGGGYTIYEYSIENSHAAKGYLTFYTNQYGNSYVTDIQYFDDNNELLARFEDTWISESGILNFPNSMLVGDDFIYGNRFDDVIFGAGGNDKIYGYGGNDLLIGNWGNDSLFGGDGNDDLRGKENDDILNGGAGDDILYGDDGNDGLYGGTGNDLLIGNWGNDAIYGDEGNDDLRGKENADFLNGGEGNDILYGDGGDDAIYGGSGNDILIGGSGNDTINGGDGVDTVIFQGSGGEYSYTFNNDLDSENILTDSQLSRDGITYLFEVERLKFSNSTFALDIDGNAGEIYRLYEAAFNRTPDDPGLTFWINVYDEGNLSLQEIAAHFIDSSEFESLYGNVDSLENSQYITYLYGNILDREPESSGFDYWVEKADEGLLFEEILVYFSESEENVAVVGSQILGGFSYDIN